MSGPDSIYREDSESPFALSGRYRSARMLDSVASTRLHYLLGVEVLSGAP